MSLSKWNGPGSVWEVDGSRLKVTRQQSGHWGVSFHWAEPADKQYLARHGLSQARFKTRARAVDAVRLALAAEPLRQEPIAGWKRAGYQTYHSRDGHWELRRERHRESMRPRSARAREALKRQEKLGAGALPLRELMSCQGQTLRVMALRVDLFNQLLGLVPPRRD